MATNKTQPTDTSITAYLDARASDAQRTDAEVLMAMLGKLTGAPATMWGPSIVGFGKYAYTYDSGRSGEAPLAGFAIRGRELVVYLSCEGAPQQALLARLGKHRMTVSCLYFKRLDDLDRAVLEQLVAGSIAETRARYG